MREIELTKGYVALIDDADLELVSRYSWSADVRRHTVYAQAYAGGSRAAFRKITMHRLIMEAREGEEVDHINNNGLDCQRHNMRKCSSTQNKRNRPKHLGTGSSRFKGVRPSGNKWVAEISVNKRTVYLGMHSTDEAAARAYDAAARKHFGEFARTNFHESAEAGL